MLVLTRKTTESIQIGDEISITVLEVRGNQVRLGIDAPRQVPVHRREIYEALQAHGSEAFDPRTARSRDADAPV